MLETAPREHRGWHNAHPRRAVPCAARQAQHNRGGTLNGLLPLPFAARVAATLLVVAPIGFHLGLPMALGMATVSQQPSWMTWGGALNGACSVLASVGAVLLAIHAEI